jgi:hypothetical protein
MLTIPKELQQAVRASHGRPLRLTAPETHTEYVLLQAEMYDQLHGLLSDDTLEHPTRDAQYFSKQGCAPGGMIQRWTSTTTSIRGAHHERAPR